MSKDCIKNEELETVLSEALEDVLKDDDQSQLGYEHPIFERLYEDYNNPWIIEEQIQFFKKANVPVVRHALPGTSTFHYYAVFPGNSQSEADILNRENNSFYRQASRKQQRIDSHEVASYDVLLEEGYDAAADTDSPEDIAVQRIMYEALSREYEDLSEEKKKICHTIMDGLTQRKAAEELNMPRGTYRDKKNATVKELSKKMKHYK